MGMYFYGYSWTNVSNMQNGLFQPRTGVSNGSNSSYAYITSLPNFQKFRERTTQEAWLFNGSTFWTLEDDVSLPFKVQYLQSHGLGGAMGWDVA